MRKNIIEILEDGLEKGITWFEKKLNMDSSKNKSNQVKKRRKKQLNQEVDYLHEDFSKSEKKGIVSMYYKQGITPPQSAERKRNFVTELEFKQRMKELEEIQQTQNQELTK